MDEEIKEQKKRFLKDNVITALCYTFIWLGGIIILIREKDNRFIRFHAMQSIVFFGSVTIIYIIIAVIERIIVYTKAWDYTGFYFIIKTFDIFTSGLTVLVFLSWLFLIVKALQSENVRLPYFGKLVDSII